MKKEYGIYIRGCDDSTCFNYELTETECELLKAIAEKSRKVSTYGCMPDIEILDTPYKKCSQCGKELKDWQDEEYCDCKNR